MKTTSYASLFALLCAATGCASERSLGTENADAGGDGSAPDAPNFADGSCAASCSSDLHSIVDCGGNVVQTCPPDQGCSGGVCVSACQAAVDAQSAVGCDFYAQVADLPNTESGDCFAAFIDNTWNAPITLAVDIAGQQFTDLTGAARVAHGAGPSLTYAPLGGTNGNTLDPNQTAIVFLSQDPSAPAACPAGVTPLLSTPDDAHAFHISASAPVGGRQIMPYGGGDSALTTATLLFPVSAWGTNHVAVQPFEPLLSDDGIVFPLIYSTIVASEDQTVVDFVPTVDLQTQGNAQAGTHVKITLNRGESVRIAPAHRADELTGMPIQSNKPIALFGAAYIFSLCVDAGGALSTCGINTGDAAQQQIPHVRAMGHEYVGVRYRDRFSTVPESTPWRLVGVADGTTLTWEGAAPSGAPATLAAGQTVDLAGPGPFVVRSQDSDHPFYVGQYMTSCDDISPDASNDCRGDPEWVNVVPAEQFLTRYTFVTDPTYPETNLVVVRARNGKGAFDDVTLDCAGTLGGWQDVGAYQFTHVDLSTGNFQGVSGCDNGQHNMSSASPFAVTIWGWGSAATGGAYRCTSNCTGFYSQAVSYAYPGGASLKSVNTVVASVPK